MLAEAKLLRQHKGRLEARMQILEDHNRQLEAQLHRLRQLLDEVTAIFENALKMTLVYLSNIVTCMLLFCIYFIHVSLTYLKQSKISKQIIQVQA